MSIGLGLLVLLAATAYDLVYTCYLSRVAARKSVPAANWSVTTYIIGIIGLGAVLNESRWYVIPEIIGLWLGTVIGVEIDKARARD